MKSRVIPLCQEVYAWKNHWLINVEEQMKQEKNIEKVFHSLNIQTQTNCDMTPFQLTALENENAVRTLNACKYNGIHEQFL